MMITGPAATTAAFRALMVTGMLTAGIIGAAPSAVQAAAAQPTCTVLCDAPITGSGGNVGQFAL